MRRRLSVLLALLAAVVALAVLGDRHGPFHDLTAEQRLSLTEQTEEVVGAVDEDVDITAFLRRDERGYSEAAALLGRYERLNRRIDWQLVDPTRSPGEARRLGVDASTGLVVIEMGGERETVATASEQDVTAGLARLLRGEAPLVCISTGHGEPDLSSTLPEGLATLAGVWQDNGYRLETVDLLATREVPAGCRALVVVQPVVAFSDEVNDALTTYLGADGRLLFLSDPSTTVDLAEIVATWGLGVRRGIVFEGDSAARFPDDPTAPIVTRYSSGNPVVRNLPPTFFPGVQEVTVDEALAERRSGLTLNRLADTSELSYLETAPVEAEFSPEEDVPGPISVLAAADQSAVRGGEHIERTRLLVSGDADIATNAFVGEGGNSRLLVQALDWLTLDENLVVLSANLPAHRPLTLTDARSRYALALQAGIVPGLFLVAGGLVWAVRRTR